MSMMQMHHNSLQIVPFLLANMFSTWNRRKPLYILTGKFSAEMSWFWQKNTWALDKLSCDCNFTALGRGEMAKLWVSKGRPSSPIWNCFHFRIQQPAFQMAGKDYNHLFKLLIIGDSSQYFTWFQIQSVYGLISHCFLESFTFLKPRSYYDISHNATGFIFIASFYCFILSWIWPSLKWSYLLLWLYCRMDHSEAVLSVLV